MKNDYQNIQALIPGTCEGHFYGVTFMWNYNSNFEMGDYL
jgi:hypothetical protein